MTWFYIAILSYLLNAIAFVFDKYLLSSRLPKPLAYAFWVSMLSSAVIVLIPFGVKIPSTYFLLVALESGITFFVGLIFLYRTVRMSDVSVASTNVGGLTAVFTYFFAVILIKENLSAHNLIAFSLLVLGLFILGRTNKHIFKWAIIAGIFFGFSSVLLKVSLDYMGTINGVFWTRMGFVGAGLFTLLLPSARKEILDLARQSKSSKILFVSNKLIATLGFAAFYIAVKLGTVSIINGLQGIQFLFIFLIAILFRNQIPGIAENFKHSVLIQKLIGLTIIAIGFSYLYLVM